LLLAFWKAKKQRRSNAQSAKRQALQAEQGAKREATPRAKQQLQAEQNQDWDKETFDAKTYCNYKICFIGAKR
jgi:hypothetical protein